MMVVRFAIVRLTAWKYRPLATGIFPIPSTAWTAFVQPALVYFSNDSNSWFGTRRIHERAVVGHNLIHRTIFNRYVSFNENGVGT